MKRKTLFLKWCVINLVSTTVVVVALILSVAHLKNVSGWTIGFTGIIGLVYIVAEVYAGKVSWNTDAVIEAGLSALSRKIMRHAAQPVETAANMCPLIGLLGMIVGVVVAMGGVASASAVDFEHAKNEALSGSGVALISTAAGVYACLVLIAEHSIIKHAIDKPLTDEVKQ